MDGNEEPYIIGPNGDDSPSHPERYINFDSLGFDGTVIFDDTEFKDYNDIEVRLCYVETVCLMYESKEIIYKT